MLIVLYLLLALLQCVYKQAFCKQN